MDFINIIGTLFDNSIEHVVALAHQIKDLRLNRNQQDINEDIYKNVQELREEDERINGRIDVVDQEIDNIHQNITTIEENITQINENINQINEKDAEQDAVDNEIKEKLQELDEVNERTDERLKFIEEGNLKTKEKYIHKLITKSSYHNLDHYERDTLYLIVNAFNDDTSVFGDQFPLILGGETEPSRFGDQFPFVLDGDNSKPSKFGDPFPFILDGIFYFKFGDKFPFILK